MDDSFNVTNPMNDEVLLKIIHQANDWCQRTFQKQQMTYDILSIWERYLELMDIGSPNWIETQWKYVKHEIFQSTNPLQMMKLSLDTGRFEKSLYEQQQQPKKSMVLE